ncbi:MAG: hypothetical protein WC797_03235 [Candidatus Paceibacterota bacterium]|jgi:hypothetical protein
MFIGTPTVTAFYRGDESLNKIRYALDLAQRLNTKLTVLLDSSSPYVKMVVVMLKTTLKMDEEVLLKTLSERIRQHIVDELNIPDYSLEVTNSADVGQSILVNNRAIFSSRKTTVLAPWKEESVVSRGSSEVMFPIGKGRSCRWALRNGLPLVKAAIPDLSVLYWHTTWLDPNVESENPEDHPCVEVRENLALAKKMADQLGVKNRQIIEIRRDVVEGLSQAILRERCCLVVMTRGLGTGFGRYGDILIRRQCPAPVLMIGLEGEPVW